MKILKRSLKTALLSIFMLSSFSLKAFSYTPYTYKVSLEEGVTFVHETIQNYDGHGGNQEINYLEFDKNNKDLSLFLVKANNKTSSKETLLNQFNYEKSTYGKKIIGGVNGEFFQMSNGQPLFTTISNKEIFSTIDTYVDSIKRPVFYVDELNRYEFDYLTLGGEIKFTTGNFNPIGINGVNRSDSYNDTNLSNYKINDEGMFYPHPGLPSRYMLIELSNSDGSIHAGERIYGRVVEVGEVEDNPIKIEKKHVLITSYGDENYENIKYEFLNKSVYIQFDIYSHKYKRIKNDIINAFTGNAYLIKDGVEMDSDYYKSLAESSLVNNRHARTAIGITEDDKVILFTVDDSKDSLGMTLKELSSYLKSLGVTNAINLDGGGSTSIALENNNYILNLMNDQTKYQRKITNGIGIIIK